MSQTTETALKLLERLPEEAQMQVLEALRQLVAESNDDAQWDTLFQGSQNMLAAAARNARAEILAGKAAPMDFNKL
ncbi:MAG: hypothetical protein ABIR36_12725 [Nitrospiraceae bacterium]